MKYLGEVIDEHGLDEHIRYEHRIASATWSTDDRRWTLEVERTDTGERLTMTAGFLWMCQGYYRHGEGYTPEWDGIDTFAGPVVHPQTWPDDLDYAGKRVVVIGSGATAATLIPAMANEAAPRHDAAAFAHVLRGQEATSTSWPTRCASLEIPEEWTHEIVRRKILQQQDMIDKASLDFPDLVKDELFKGIREYLGDDFDLSTALHPELPARGSSASRSCPTATCSRPSLAARRRWSPTRSTTSTRTASCWRPATASTPTSSSPPPAST